MWGRRSALAAVSAAGVLGFTAEAIAQIGVASSVVPAARYARGSVVQDLAVNDPLHQDDRVRTSASGSTQVRLRDDTMLTIGPNSEVVLDRFIYDGSRAQTATIEVVRGAMRFVSGTSDRRAYEIRTPVATIGVRGTVVDIGGSDRSIVHFIDGSGPVCHRRLRMCRTFGAGEGWVITLNGFSPASYSELSALWRRLDGAHLSLSRAIGRDPAAPIGAAAGSQGGDKEKENKDETYGEDPNVSAANLVPNPFILPNAAPPPPTGPGPAFPGDPVAGGTGPNFLLPTNTFICTQACENEQLFGSPATFVWDAGTDGAFRGGEFRTTPDPGGDPNPITILRETAIATNVVTQYERIPEGISLPASETPVPIYQIGMWTDGDISFSQAGEDGLSGTSTLAPNQAIHYLIYTYSGELFPTIGSLHVAKGMTFMYRLETATLPTWTNGSRPPGTFSGFMSVGMKWSGVYYGFSATLTMPNESGPPDIFAMYTDGGASNPFKSSISQPLNSSEPIRADINVHLISGSATHVCTDGPCDVTIVPIFPTTFVSDGSFKPGDPIDTPGRIGMSYRVSVGQGGEGGPAPQIQGSAVFVSTSLPASSYAAVVGGDGTGTFHEQPIAGDAKVKYADAESLASGLALKEVDFDWSWKKRTRGTASVVDQGSIAGIVGWERWTGGTVKNAFNQTITLSDNQGVHIVHGMPATNIPHYGTYEYNLAGATQPTMADGSVPPGTLLDNSKMAVAFSHWKPKIGMDLYVSIGGGTYNVRTYGGATNPYASNIYAANDGSFSGSHIPTTLLSGTNLVCPYGGCKGSVSGSLMGPGASHIGIVYTFGNAYSNPGSMVSGAAAFSKGGSIGGGS